MPDLDKRAEAATLLDQFRERFPVGKLRSMKPWDYCQGEGNPDCFCNWLENKLAKLGTYGLGSASSHLIYRRKDGTYYVLRGKPGTPVEESLAWVMELHARVVELGETDSPQSIEAMDLTWEGHTERLINPGKIPSRVLKVLHSYFPERFFPVNSVVHLDTFLEGLGVPKHELPAGFIEKNLLLLAFHEKHVASRGIDVLDFSRILYDSEIAPFTIAIKKREVFEGALRFFRLFNGEGGFSAEAYLLNERNYKDALREKWLPIAESLRQESTREAELAQGRSIVQFLQPSKDQNLLNWRYTAGLKGVDEEGLIRLARATKSLLFYEGESPDVETFNRVLFSLSGAGGEGESEQRPASRSIPSFLLWINDPEREFFIRSDSLSAFTRLVCGKDQIRSSVLTNRDYVEWRRFASEVKELLEKSGVQAKDYIDIQGFIWQVTKSVSIWFAECSFNTKENQLERFRQDGIWAWQLGDEMGEKICSWVADNPELTGWESGTSPLSICKKDFQTQFKAFANLVKTGGAVIAKRTFYDQDNRASVLGIDGLFLVKAGTHVRVDGHDLILAAEWRGESDLELDNSLFGKVSRTVQEIDASTTFAIIGQAKNARVERTESISGTVPETVSAKREHSSVDAPLNLILYGPPGTGKTWTLTTKYVPQFHAGTGEEVDLERTTFLTFHQNYSYEDFVEGIRPVAGSAGDGTPGFVVKPGALKRACLAACRLAGWSGSLDALCRLPKTERKKRFGVSVPRFALFIDEINRGNVSRIFGELITLIEDDKRLGEENEIVVDLPYSCEKFGIPPNLHIIGTMNSADRSIALLDTALRRRFEFIELMPDYIFLGTIPMIGPGIDLAALVGAMNERIEFVLGREHQIGHGYFTPLLKPGLDADARFKELGTIFRRKILPLLAEYFFDDWRRISLVLADNEKDEDSRFVMNFQSGKWTLPSSDVVDANGGQGVWRIRDSAFSEPEAFRRIYE